MDTVANDSVMLMLDHWRAEEREMEDRVDDICSWMQQVNQLGIPRFGEAANRLRPLRQRMVGHFDSEDELIAELTKDYPTSDPGIDGVREHSTDDRVELLSRMDDLITRLEQTVPPFASWEAAMDDVSVLVKTLHWHEQHESESPMLLTIGPYRVRMAK